MHHRSKRRVFDGNYYSWPAATTTSGETGQASDSICPTGWKLPTSGSNTGKGSFEYLLKQYGWESVNTKPDQINSNAGINASPLYFVYGGYLSNSGGIPEGLLNNVGGEGSYWSSKQRNDGTGAYSLNFSGNTYPSSSWSHYRGFSVRCLAK